MVFRAELEDFKQLTYFLVFILSADLFYSCDIILALLKLQMKELLLELELILEWTIYLGPFMIQLD